MNDHGSHKHENSDGIVRYYNSYSELHRLDGPAFQDSTGYKAWYKHGYRHRTNGPAIEYCDGSKSWYLNGLLHREDGPAIKRANGNVEYWINGIWYNSLEEGLMDQALG